MVSWVEDVRRGFSLARVRASHMLLLDDGAGGQGRAVQIQKVGEGGSFACTHDSFSCVDIWSIINVKGRL